MDKAIGLRPQMQTLGRRGPKNRSQNQTAEGSKKNKTKKNRQIKRVRQGMKRQQVGTQVTDIRQISSIYLVQENRNQHRKLHLKCTA